MKRICTLFFINAFSIANCEVVVLDNNIDGVLQHEGDKSNKNDQSGEDNIKGENKQSSDLQNNDTSQQKVEQQQNDNKSTSNAQPTRKKVHAILDLTLGNEHYNNDIERIDVYVAPTCLHCGKFLVEDLQDFIDKHSQKCFIRIRLLPVSAKDLFVMKIIQSEARDVNGYYMIYLNYIRRTLATVKNIKPTEQQQKLYKGSATDPDMIKYQAVASAFGFSDEKIVAAYPNMDDCYETAVMNWYKNVVKILDPFCPNKNLDLPLIIQNGKSYKNITDVPLPN